MEKNTYRLVFSGELAEGADREQVVERLTRLFKKTPQQLESLFDGSRHVLKGKLTQDQAQSFRKVLEATGARVTVESAPAVTTPTPTETFPQDDIRASFRGRIEPVHVTPLYLLAMAGVTLMMLLIPLIYAAIIGAAGYGLYYHATENLDILEGGGSGRLLIYLTPIVVGGVLVVFMLKPFLLFRGEKRVTIALDPQQEKRLFAFVHCICDAVGARYPSRIEMDNEVNASAGFYRGLRGMVRNELVLTIGAPLVAGMNMRQLGGILAHEFGHFSQGAAMRMSYLINWVNHWLYRAVYQRDVFDEKLERWAAGGIIYTIVILQAARFFVWLTRRILWLFMHLGGIVSSLMSRQMEFDADRYEARLAGSEQFARTSDKLNELSFAAQEVHEAQYQIWSNQSRLLADFPAAVAQKAASCTPQMRQQILEVVAARKADLFDTHPPHPERVASAERESCPGIFHNESPACELFADFDLLAREVTRHFYRHELGLKIDERQLIDHATFESETQRFESERNAMLTFFLEMHSADAPIRIVPPDWNAPLDIDALRKEWDEVCMRQRYSVELTRQTLEDYDQIYSERMNAMAARALLEAGFSIEAEEFGLPVAYVADAENKMESTHEEQQRLLGKLQNNAAHGYQRLQLALSLLSSKSVRQAMGDTEALKREVMSLAEVQSAIVTAMAPIIELRHHNYVMVTLLQNLDNKDDQKVREQLEKAMDALRGIISPLLSQLSNVPFPFEHSEGRLTLAGYLYRDAELPDNPYAMHQLADYLDDDLRAVFYRILGRLCAIALQLEQLFGLECKPLDE